MRDEFWDTAPHYGGSKGNISSDSKISNVRKVNAVH